MANGAGGLVLFEKDGPLARLTLNRPEALNAVSLEMRDLLWTYLQAVRDDPDVRVIVLRGAGERAFCAGADVKEFGTAPSFVAAIHGFALGAGCEMSLYCDLRIAAEDARFGLPEVTLGYIPSAGGTQTLPRYIPRGVALGMIATGEPIDASRALQLGLVHRVVPLSELDEAADRAALALASLPVEALSAAREAQRVAADLSL